MPLTIHEIRSSGSTLDNTTTMEKHTVDGLVRNRIHLQETNTLLIFEDETHQAPRCTIRIGCGVLRSHTKLTKRVIMRVRDSEFSQKKT